MNWLSVFITGASKINYACLHFLASALGMMILTL